MNKNIQAIYPLTPLQEGILYHTIEMPNSDIYFQQFSCGIEHLDDPEKWHQSWQTVAQSHAIMRTLFTWSNRPQPLQIVRERVTLPWHELNWSEYSSLQQGEKWASLMQRDRDLGFELSTAPLMRFTLVKIGPHKYHFLFSFHHIVLDGWSQRLLFDQALANYNSKTQLENTNVVVDGESTKHTYSSFIEWLGKQDKDHAKTFWTKKLLGFEVPTNIVNDMPVVANNTETVDKNKRSTQELSIKTSIVEKLNAQARRHQLTLNSLLLGAWSLILGSHNRTHDVLFGTTVAGRPIDLPNADKIAGLFINTLPFRTNIDAQSTLADWLATLQSSQAACREYEQTPLTDIQRYSELSSGTPLFESILVVENLPSAASSKESSHDQAEKITIYDPHYTEYSHYPLAILIDPSDGLNLIAVHQESKVSAARAQAVLDQLLTVLLQMSQSLDTRVANVVSLPDITKQKQLTQWNRTQHDFSDVIPVHQMFEKWALATPDHTAIIDTTGDKEQRLSYAHINTQANRLAHFLRTKSLKPSSIVPILLERSARFLISLLAVMKAGGAYIPLDTDQPAQRHTAIISSLQDDNLVLISQSSLQHKVDSSVSIAHKIILDECHSQIENCSSENVNLQVDLDQLAYVIYTSGSTGVPKGVMIEHKALANSTLARNTFYPSAPTTFLLLSSLATDSSIAGIYWTLCSGGTLVLSAKRLEQDMQALEQKISDYSVTHLLCIPSLYQLILENTESQNLQHLNTVIVAGESCNQSVIQLHQQVLPTTELYNEYGPSECCVWATASCLTHWHGAQEVSIGRAISNTQIYVLDQNLQPVLPHITGELYIGGANIARGYLHQDEKTAEVFVENPFSESDLINQSKLYKTGDLVKYTSNGDLIFIGRADNQVKLRGFRIEPEEIEHVLCSHPLIEEALVFVEIPAVSDDCLFDALVTLEDDLAKALLADIGSITELISEYKQQISQLSATQKQTLADKLSLKPDKAKAKLLACVSMVNNETVDTKVLKNFAQSLLPMHFVPHVWKQVQALPRTSIGKIQRQHAQSFGWQELAKQKIEKPEESANEVHDKFDIFGNNNYIAPTNETEIILAKIWSEVLGAGDISIHDEFLEVGGDSLLSIRILARINKAGLNIATQDFFEFPTIAGQAKAISKASENSYEKGSTKGKFALIPIQHWLFERIQINPQHWNQSKLIAVDESLDFPSLERAFQKVVLQHDALRIAFVQTDVLPNAISLEKNTQHWQQEYLPLDAHLAVDFIDISQLSEQQQSDSIEQQLQLMNRSMNLSKGNLARLAFFKTAPGTANKLAMVIHHLIIDVESWYILLEDLQNCWATYAQGKTPELPRKTTSFKHWSEKLFEYASSDLLSTEVTYWETQTSHTRLPVDFNLSDVTGNKLATGGIAENTVGSGDVISTSLDKEQTALLLLDLPKKLKVEVKDALLTALVIAINNWTHSEQVLIDIEGHGRENLFENVDTSRTIGWFTTAFPVLFSIDSFADPIATLVSVSTTLSAIPKKGIGYGLLRENRSDNTLKQQPYSEIGYNFLGQVDTQKSGNSASLLTQIASNIGEPRGLTGLRTSSLEINARIEKEQLHVDWSYSRNLHKTGTIEKLAEDFNQALSDLLSLEQPEASEQGETDLFDLVDLENDDLDALTKALSGDN